jgi:hypothetical protein
MVFGPVALTDTATGVVKFYNKGTVNKLTISAITHKSSGFKFTSALPLTINPNDSAQLTIRFNVNSATPNGYGNWPDTLEITSDGGSAKVALMGLSPRPTIQFSTRRIVFGDVGVYDVAAVDIKVTNTSANRLQIDSVLNRTNAFVPSVRSCSVSNKDTVTLTVQFIPTRFGFHTDSLLVWSNADTYLIYVDLSGNCPYPAMVIKPPQIDFGTVRKDSTVQKLFSIQDTSISRLQVDSLWTGTKYFDVFRILANHTVKKGDSVAITIRFTPDTARQFIDTLFIANTSQISPCKVPLYGNGTTTGVMQFGNDIPKAYTLYQNYPNPFNPSTVIRFGIPTRSRVRLSIYNLLGQQVTELVNQELNAGYFEKSWNAVVASGLYLYRVEAISVNDPNRKFVSVKKMLLLR